MADKYEFYFMLLMDGVKVGFEYHTEGKVFHSKNGDDCTWTCIHEIIGMPGFIEHNGKMRYKVKK